VFAFHIHEGVHVPCILVPRYTSEIVDHALGGDLAVGELEVEIFVERSLCIS
jgi:hypothetical protein